MEIIPGPNLNRQAAYRLLAALFLYPEQDRFGTIESGAVGLLELAESADDVPAAGMPSSMIALCESLAENTIDTSELETDYVELFRAACGGICHPYEGAYSTPEQAARLVVELEQLYAQNGLRLSTSDLPDHLTTELEFLSFLCAQQQLAENTDSDTAASEIRLRSLSFVYNHIGRWIPILSQRVSEKTDGLYALAVKAAVDLVSEHQASLEQALEGMGLLKDRINLSERSTSDVPSCEFACSPNAVH